MGLQQCEAAQWALRSYVDAVAHALGVGSPDSCSDFNDPASAYIALRKRLPGYPDRDCALVWDGRYGWAVAVETASGEDMLVLTYLGGDVVATPRVVDDFLTGVYDGQPAQTFPPHVRVCSDLASELSVYAPAVEAG